MRLDILVRNRVLGLALAGLMTAGAAQAQDKDAAKNAAKAQKEAAKDASRDAKEANKDLKKDTKQASKGQHKTHQPKIKTGR
jgi:hypothetical protein